MSSERSGHEERAAVAGPVIEPFCFLLFYHAGTVKGGDEIVAGTVCFLYKAVFNAAVKEILLRFPILFLRQATIDFRESRSVAAGDILPHQAEQNLSFRERFCYPVNDALGVFQLSRQDKMANDDAFL